MQEASDGDSDNHSHDFGVGDRVGLASRKTDNGLEFVSADERDYRATGATVTAIDEDEITIEYPGRLNATITETVGVESVISTDFEAGDRVIVTYESVKSEKDQERHGEVVSVTTTRLGYRYKIRFDNNDQTYIVGDLGTVLRTDGDRRKIGRRAVVETEEE